MPQPNRPTQQKPKPKPKPAAAPPAHVQIGRHMRALPASAMNPDDASRAQLRRQVERIEKLRAQHAAELAAKDAQLAQQARDHRRDSLVIIASQRAEQAGLDAAAVTKFINNVLAADAKPRREGVKFDVYACMKELLDQAHKASQGAAGVIDVRKLSPEAYRAHLRKRGLVDPIFGSHNPL